jgi:hypothetical protein
MWIILDKNHFFFFSFHATSYGSASIFLLGIQQSKNHFTKKFIMKTNPRMLIARVQSAPNSTVCSFDPVVVAAYPFRVLTESAIGKKKMMMIATMMK